MWRSFPSYLALMCIAPCPPCGMRDLFPPLEHVRDPQTCKHTSCEHVDTRMCLQGSARSRVCRCKYMHPSTALPAGACLYYRHLSPSVLLNVTARGGADRQDVRQRLNLRWGVMPFRLDFSQVRGAPHAFSPAMGICHNLCMASVQHVSSFS